jgi:NADPH:quinone reductase-like Zn-dependent oxidoreductase
MLSMFVDQRLLGLVSRENQEDLQTRRELLETGKVTPVIDQTYPLVEAPDAIRYLAEGHPRGKIVITI